MLTLTRVRGQEIVIGDPTRPLGSIKVVELGRGNVRLAFDFPREVKINRGEVAKKIVAEGRRGVKP